MYTASERADVRVTRLRYHAIILMALERKLIVPLTLPGDIGWSGEI
jgi:hypothetical protein